LTSKQAEATNDDLLSDRLELLRDFLRDNVSSYEELEALLFLAKNPERDWSAAEVADVLKAAVDIMRDALETLRARDRMVAGSSRAGVVVYRYACSDASLEKRVDDLRRAYEEERLSVVQMMTGNALDRVRRAAVLRLADAFRLEMGKK
jgi:metal-responsive CopG/Arc/MetJ family transcriptional regulator